jgi:hypothetical protein
MKRFTFTTALKAVLVGVVISGMATACQNGDSTIGGFIAKDDQATAGVNTGGATTQDDTERKAKQSKAKQSKPVKSRSSSPSRK